MVSLSLFLRREERKVAQKLTAGFDFFFSFFFFLVCDESMFVFKANCGGEISK